MRHQVSRYVFAAAAALLTTGAAVVLHPLIAFLPSPPFLLTVLIVAWVAGFGPAVLAIAVSAAALDWFFIPPLLSVASSWSEVVSVLAFAAVGLTIARLAAGQRRARDERLAALSREQQARDEAERVAERLRAVQSIVDTTIPHAGLEHLLRAMLGQVRQSLKSDTASILLLQEDGRHLSLAASEGHRPHMDEGMSVPLGLGVAGQIAASQAGLLIDDPASPFLTMGVKSLVGVPLRVAGRLIGVIHMGSLTAHRFAEGDLVLLRLVADRAALALERARLLEAESAARAAAESANRAKDEFLAVLGHELRNPLSAITTSAHLLDVIGSRDEPARRAREVIARQAQQLSRMVDDLLDVNRVIAGKILLNCVPVDLAEAVQGAVATLGATGKLERHALKMQTEPVWVQADPVRLEQIVVNLLDNALKYTPPGGALALTVRSEGGDGLFRVTDSGVGISADLLPRIFDLFVQGELGAGRPRGGLGIGLTVVRRLAELQGGTVDASSEGPGLGSTFTVHLPRVPGPAARPARDSAPPGPARRVLIVEDDPDTRALLRHLLQASGHEVYQAGDGSTAIAVAITARPEFVLVDIGPSEVEGSELARRIRQTPEGRAAVLVALGDEARSEALRPMVAGFDHYLLKPVEPAQLAEILGR